MEERDCGFYRMGIGLLDMPLVQAGKPHGDPFPPEAHAALQFCFAAHVEGTDAGNFGKEAGND